jgi:tetratricopeptide (TPR) repeat protein
MSYINVFLSALLILILSACSNTVGTKGKNTQGSQSTESSVEELMIYKEAIIALNNNELDKAADLFTTMSKRQPNIAGPWANLALIEIKKENVAQAELYVKTALDNNPDMPQALNLSGYLAQKQGKINLAKSYYLQAINNKADYALAHYNVALLYDVYLQDIGKAIEHYQLYLTHLGDKDEATQNWLEGLKATMAATNS